MRRSGLKEQVLALRVARPDANSTELADSLGVLPEYVRATLVRAGMSMTGVHSSSHCTISKDALERLLPFAEKRNISVRLLASRLIDVISERGSIDEILDDEVSA